MKTYTDLILESPLDNKKKKAIKLIKDLQTILVEIQKESDFRSTAKDIGKIMPQLQTVIDTIKRLN